MEKKTKTLNKVGFEPTPFRTSALSWRLRPLGHLSFVEVLQAIMTFKLKTFLDFIMTI